MYLASHIKNALRNLMTSRMRSFLAMLSIMIGTASVVALVSSGQLATEEALTQFQSLGTDLMSVNFESGEESKSSAAPVNLLVVEKLPSLIPDIAIIAPFLYLYPSVYFKKKSWENIIVGATPTLAKIINIRMKQGRFLTDFDRSRKYCVLGASAAKNLNVLSPVGERIQLGNVIYTVIGVAHHWRENSFFTQDINQVIIVPIQTISQISNSAPLTDAVMTLKKGANIDLVKQGILDFFKKIAPGYKVTLQSAQEMIVRMSAQQQIFTLLLGLIGGIALLVGGIGVMNIMLASVAERRNEIGLRLALGAQPKDIQLMFIMESVILALVGGGLGVVLGISSTMLIARIAGWNFILFIIPPIIGLSVSIMVSVFFGFYPAYKASKLNPIEALRGS